MYLDPETRPAPFDQTAITESPAYILTLSTIHFFHGVTVPSCNPASLVSFSLHISLSFTQVSPCQTFFLCVWFSFLQTKFLACQEKALHTVQRQTRWAQAAEMISFKSHSRECVFLLTFFISTFHLSKQERDMRILILGQKIINATMQSCLLHTMSSTFVTVRQVASGTS